MPPKKKKSSTIPTKSEGDLKELLAALKDDINSLRAEVKDDINSLRAEVKDDVKSLRGDVKSIRAEVILFFLFVLVLSGCFYSFLCGERDYVTERAKALQEVSGLGTFEHCSSAVTYFGLSIDGSVADVTVSHLECDANRTALLACPGVDIALSTGCPKKGKALVGERSAAPVLGERIVAFGFTESYGSLVWDGILANYHARSLSSGEPFSGTAQLPNDSFLITCDQQKGMSGAAALNSAGLVGVVSAVDAGSFNNSRVCAVTPVSYVVACMKRFKKQLSTVEECRAKQGLQLVEPPALLGVADTFSRLIKYAGEMLAGQRRLVQ